jgi:hypothetical protein
MTAILSTLTHAHAQRRTTNMTITYSIWDGAQLLGVDFKASSAEEMNKTVAELQKVSKNVKAHMRKVEQN